jgi:hypothetical protein
MFRHCGKRPVINTRRLMLTALVLVLSWATGSPHASALEFSRGSRATFGNGGDGGGNKNWGHINVHTGNGRFNRNDASVFSPQVTRGRQQAANTNQGGQTNTQIAGCQRRHRSCCIHQWMRAR